MENSGKAEFFFRAPVQFQHQACIGLQAKGYSVRGDMLHHGKKEAETRTQKTALISFTGPESFCGLRGYVKREALPKKKEERTVEGSGRQKTYPGILNESIVS